MSCEDLVLRAKQGDKLALEKLMDRFKFYIIKCSNNVYINGHDRDDLIQIGYISLKNAVDKYDLARGNFTSYVQSAIKYNFNYLIREKARENYVTSLNTFIAEDVELGDIVGVEASFEEEIMKNEILKQLRKCIDKLPIDLREIIDYCYINNKGNFKQYSQVKNIKYSTLIKKKDLALETLKHLLMECDVLE